MKSTRPAGRAGPELVATASPSISRDRAALIEQLLRLSDAAAAEGSGFDDAWIDLGGRAVRLRFASPAMAERLLPALSHLLIDARDEAALTIRVWDSASTSTPPPVATWDPDDFRERGIIRGFFGEGFYTVYEWGPSALNVVDVESGLAFLWMRSWESLGLPERGAPMRTLLNLWLSGGDVQLVHGAAVGRADGCVLLIGPSGAGKSSTALSCLGSGLGLLGEDYCLASRGDPPSVWSVYSSAKLDPAALGRLPTLEPLVAAMPEPDDPEGKALLSLGDGAGKLIRTAPLRAIAVPRVGRGRDTTSRRCTSGAALAMVAPSTMLQLPGNGEPAMRWLAELVTSVPTYELELGSEPSLIPPALKSLMDAS